MRKKEMRTVVTFYTTADAMAMEQYCKVHDIAGKLIPVPRSLSAGCGLAWSAPLSDFDVIKEELEHGEIEVQDICTCLA